MSVIECTCKCLAVMSVCENVQLPRGKKRNSLVCTKAPVLTLLHLGTKKGEGRESLCSFFYSQTVPLNGHLGKPNGDNYCTVKANQTLTLIMTSPF